MSAASEYLRTHQDQLDANGVIVGVSRKAVDEVLAEIERLRAALEKITKVEDRHGQEARLVARKALAESK